MSGAERCETRPTSPTVSPVKRGEVLFWSFHRYRAATTVLVCEQKPSMIFEAAQESSGIV